MQGIETILKEQNLFIGKTAGDSMAPMLQEGRDTVIIVPPTFPLSPGAVPVYRRDGHYTMHRIIKCTRHGYLISSDNRPSPEKDIKNEDIIGVLAAFYRDGQYVACTDAAYLAYARKMCRTYRIRRLRHICRRLREELIKLFGKGKTK